MQNERIIQRGNIYYVESAPVTGCEQKAGRPAIIVSNNIGNRHSPVVEVVFLTTKTKTNLPTHVMIQSTERPSTAICEQISPVSVSRLSRFYGRCSYDEMKKIDEALCISLALTNPILVNKLKRDYPSEMEVDILRKKLIAIEAQNVFLRNMYDKLIKKFAANT